MNFFAITYSKDESFFLPRWARYYGSQIGYENLFIVDHASRDLSTTALREANILRMPDTPFSDYKRAESVSYLHRALISGFYDGGFITDVDEFIVANPDKYRNLHQYLEVNRPLSRTPVGLELLHIPLVDGAFQDHLPILAQRKRVFFNLSICKHSYASVPTTFGGGLHSSTNKPIFDQDLILLHLKHFDYNWRMNRQLITRSWTYDSDFGSHARQEADKAKMFVDGLISRFGRDWEPGFDFEKEILRAQKELIVRDNNMYSFGQGFFSETGRDLPASYSNLF